MLLHRTPSSIPSSENLMAKVSIVNFVLCVIFPVVWCCRLQALDEWWSNHHTAWAAAVANLRLSSVLQVVCWLLSSAHHIVYGIAITECSVSHKDVLFCWQQGPMSQTGDSQLPAAENGRWRRLCKNHCFLCKSQKSYNINHSFWVMTTSMTISDKWLSCKL